MLSYTMSTGAAGTMRVDDDGSANVDLYLLGVNELVTQVPWTVTLNGVTQSWKSFRLEANVAWQKVATLFVENDQTIEFKLGATGNAKLGGPTDFPVDIQRAATIVGGTGYARITIANVVHQAIPFVKDDGEWKQAESWGRIAGVWGPST